jgi:hypothetical protein
MRLHDNLVASHTEAVHQMQKALFEMNVQLTNVISGITAGKRRLGTLISAPMGAIILAMVLPPSMIRR